MIKAVWDAIIVKVDEKAEKMHGKFIIPDLSQEKAIIGNVIDVGPGRWNNAGDALIPMSFKVGDRVVLPQVGPTKLEWDGVEYIAVSEAQVLALIVEQN
jgi:chaperonin GroES